MTVPWPWAATRLSSDFFARSAEAVAPDLLGLKILVQKKGQWLGGTICETECYCEDDPASHSFLGQNPRNQSMFDAPGTIYVYQSYGIHFCLNVSTGAKGQGEAVLIRAFAAEIGIDQMTPGASADTRRFGSGPGRLCAALGIDKSFDGLSPESERIVFIRPDHGEAFTIIRGARIGISKGLELPWRFGIKDHPSLSRPFPKKQKASAYSAEAPSESLKG